MDMNEITLLEKTGCRMFQKPHRIRVSVLQLLYQGSALQLRGKYPEDWEKIGDLGYSSRELERKCATACKMKARGARKDAVSWLRSSYE